MSKQVKPKVTTKPATAKVAASKTPAKAPVTPAAVPTTTPVAAPVKRAGRGRNGGEVAPNDASDVAAQSASGDANTNELATVSATSTLSLRDLTISRYQSRGWQIMNTPRGGINDLVAGKSVNNKYKYHFVQFVDSEDDIDTAARYKGEAKGAFIQNAYSNQATPVYVIPRRSGANRKVVLENADTTQKIIP
ncbi:putative DNA repair ATPase [Faustovirus]|nr:putative DNA repair ATPase [Faustovirus]